MRLQMLVRAHVAANTDVETRPGGALSDEELQEGLMAGYGSRARRKHLQRHAKKRSAQQAPPAMQEAEDSAHIAESSEDEEAALDSASQADADEPDAAAGATNAADGTCATGEASHIATSSVVQQGVTADASEMSNYQQSSAGAPSNAAQTSDRPPACELQRKPQRTSATDLGRGGHFWHGERYSFWLGHREALCTHCITGQNLRALIEQLEKQ